jgi:CHAT domain
MGDIDASRSLHLDLSGVASFEPLTSGITVGAALERMHEHRFGLVPRAGGSLALVHRDLLLGFNRYRPLSEIIGELPAAPTLPVAAASDLPMLARHVSEELYEHDDLPGIVLVTDEGTPFGVVPRGDLLETFATTSDTVRALPPIDEPAAEAASASESTLMVSRYTDIRFPARVAVGESHELTVSVIREPPPSGSSVELKLLAQDWPLPVTVSLVAVSPDDFLVVGPVCGVILVPRDEDSEALTFTFVPIRPGPRTIRLRFEQGHEFLGITRVATEVVPDRPQEQGTAEVEHGLRLTHKGRAPDVTIHIEREADLTYAVRVRTREDAVDSAPLLIDRLRFDQPPSSMVDELLRRVESTAARDPAGNTRQLVERAGSFLWETAFRRRPHPSDQYPGFPAFYVHTMLPRAQSHIAEQRWSTVQIVSDEPDLPWEIMRPSWTDADGRRKVDQFLCERFLVSRWLSDATSVPTIPVRKAAVISPPSGLQWVASEVATIRTLIPAPIEIGDKPALDAFLATGGADVVHFACHGDFRRDDPLESVVMIGTDEFTRVDLAGEFSTFGRYRPLVFLNACDSGRLAGSPTGVAGWAQAFLAAGAGAFIGCLWSVGDQSASAFAQAFYTHLMAGDTIGAATSAARQEAARIGDASHLSYTVFANPTIRLARPART